MITRSHLPIVRRYISRRLTQDIESEPATVNDLVQLATRGEPDVAEDILAGMAEALRGWSKAPQPAAWAAAADAFAKGESSALKNQAQELGVVFGDGRAADELRAIVTNTNAEADARRQALRALLAGRPKDLAGLLQTLAADRGVAIEAIRGLASYDDPATPTTIFNSWQRYTPVERAAAIDTLCTRPEYAHALLAMLREGRLAKSDISAFHARAICALDDPQLNSELSELWGEVRGVDRREASHDRAHQISRHSRGAGRGQSQPGEGPVSKALRNLPCPIRRRA